MTEFQALGLKIFFACGGLAAVLGILSRGVKPAVELAVHWAVGTNHPKAREIALAHRAWLESVFDDADAAFKDALEAEAAKKKLIPGRYNIKPIEIYRRVTR